MVELRVDFAKKVFDIRHEPMPKGSWWWWFWLFFFNNPKNPDKPRQLMILWSAKNEKTIYCNDMKLDIKLPLDRTNLDGAVAAWYFDGNRMHHNFLLDKCHIKVGKDSISTDSKTPTSFAVNGTKSVVRIGRKMEFIAKENTGDSFKKSLYHSDKLLGNMGYSILKLNHTELTGKLEGKNIKGTAYFQRVFVNAPAIPWYWGIFHFEKGAAMTYTNHFVFGKNVKKDISFFDGKDMHIFKNMKVVRKGTDIPNFEVSGENEKSRISFTVKSYAHSSWIFRKRAFGLIPNRLVYNEYPATISDIMLEDRKTGKKKTSEDFGTAVGNAEHTTGLLL
ncbi:MAG: hypothetical protein J7K54_04835 [Candidatus Aenigmarchaeota archaeon]|nr:hypothetical protein [Candidatus Aenigmarchaeota archaeon]